MGIDYYSRKNPVPFLTPGHTDVQTVTVQFRKQGGPRLSWHKNTHSVPAKVFFIIPIQMPPLLNLTKRPTDQRKSCPILSLGSAEQPAGRWLFK